jgi:hypothetical protein
VLTVVVSILAGFAAIIELEQLQAIAGGGASATAGLPSWDEFKADLQEGKMSFPSVRSPFLFAGKGTVPCQRFLFKS